ncbi:MAG: hypothetical protein M0R70_07105 [Nitrospirae bacterium]|nr:hypothetical protein [Nitrospirota bacterium]
MGLLGRFFGRAKSKQTDSSLTPEVAEKIVNDYGAVLASAVPAPGCVADERKLPHPKEHIKQALVFALCMTKEPQMREQLKIAYITLADWQQGVGDAAVGLDLTKMDLNAEPDELAKQIMSQGADVEKWLQKVKAEQESLRGELQKRGLW